MKRFVFGVATGLFIAGIFWSYSAFYYISISLIQDIAGTVLLALCCGVVATISSIDKLMDNINFPF